MAEPFRPGHRALASGVYKAIHAKEHVQPHYVTMLYGDSFPSCLHCSDQVRFELAVSAVHVNAHVLFKRF